MAKYIDRKKFSLRREEVEKTGRPFYTRYDLVPKGLHSKTQCLSMGVPVLEGEEAAAYVLNRQWKGYLPLYERKEIFEMAKSVNAPKGHELESFMFDEQVDVIGTMKMAFVAGGQGGGKIATESVRLGHYGLFYNTSSQDLAYTDAQLKELKEAGSDIKYDMLKLNGFEGANKDREIGKKAILDNQEDVKEQIGRNKEIRDADFTWVVVALGGGTGNGSMAVILNLVSRIRKNKTFNGRPTVGVIAAIPQDDALPRIKVNAGKAMQEIQKLQASGVIGSCLIIDNEKLSQDYLNNHKDVYDEWTTFGNLQVSSIMNEVIGSLSLTGPEAFDKSEFLDLITQSGMLLFGKHEITSKFKSDEDEEKYLADIAHDVLHSSSVFADGYNNQHITNLGTVIIKHRDSKILSDAQAQTFRRHLRKLLENTLAEKDHFGIHHTDVSYGEKKDGKMKEKVIIYTVATNYNAPKRVVEMLQSAQEKENARKKLLEEAQANLLGVDLTVLDIDTKKKEDVVGEDDFEELDLGDLSVDISLGDSKTDDDMDDDLLDLNLDDLGEI